MLIKYLVCFISRNQSVAPFLFSSVGGKEGNVTVYFNFTLNFGILYLRVRMMQNPVKYQFIVNGVAPSCWKRVWKCKRKEGSRNLFQEKRAKHLMIGNYGVSTFKSGVQLESLRFHVCTPQLPEGRLAIMGEHKKVSQKSPCSASVYSSYFFPLYQLVHQKNRTNKMYMCMYMCVCMCMRVCVCTRGGGRERDAKDWRMAGWTLWQELIL